MDNNLSSSFEAIKRTVAHIQTLTTIRPQVGIVCGSGLGKLADDVKNPQVIKYEDIPNFPRSTVSGHAGNFVFGELGGKPVMVMQGRFHLYEGFGVKALRIPIRVMHLMGVKILLLSNAAGGLNSSYKLGDLVIIKDHISLPGLTPNNPLVGPNDEKFGERFFAMSDAYSSRLRRLFKSISESHKCSDIVHEGVYAHVSGPSYETPAECRMLKMCGADVVGMSTAPEVAIARHVGMEVFAISLVTNLSVMDQESSDKANHEEVLQVAATRTETLKQLFGELIGQV